MMYDELVKRLRMQADAERFFSGESMLYEQAADAIEKLVKERDDWKTTAKLERDGMLEWFEDG